MIFIVHEIIHDWVMIWVVDAYMISYGGFLLLAGRLGDLVGRKRVFLVGLATTWPS
jgi:MFS family permease